MKGNTILCSRFLATVCSCHVPNKNPALLTLFALRINDGARMNKIGGCKSSLLALHVFQPNDGLQFFSLPGKIGRPPDRSHPQYVIGTVSKHKSSDLALDE